MTVTQDAPSTAVLQGTHLIIINGSNLNFFLNSPKRVCSRPTGISHQQLKRFIVKRDDTDGEQVERIFLHYQFEPMGEPSKTLGVSRYTAKLRGLDIFPKFLPREACGEQGISGVIAEVIKATAEMTNLVDLTYVTGSCIGLEATLAGLPSEVAIELIGLPSECADFCDNELYGFTDLLSIPGATYALGGRQHRRTSGLHTAGV